MFQGCSSPFIHCIGRQPKALVAVVIGVAALWEGRGGGGRARSGVTVANSLGCKDALTHTRYDGETVVGASACRDLDVELLCGVPRVIAVVPSAFALAGAAPDMSESITLEAKQARRALLVRVAFVSACFQVM